MVDQKSKVISVVRSLLISDSSGRALSVNELSKEYCLYEGKSIPTFGHRNVEEFLRASGDFDFDNKNGVCVVREKVRSNSFHIKKLVAEQKRERKRKTISINSRFLPSSHLRSRSRSVTRLLPSNHNSTYNPKSSHNSGGSTVPVPYHQNHPTISFTFDELKENWNSKSTCNFKLFHGNTYFGYAESNTDQHSNELSSFRKVVDSHASNGYSSTVDIQIKRNNNYEATNISANITHHANELSSFRKLRQMRKGLLYQRVRDSIGYRSTVEVDGVKYTGGTCDTAVAANNNVAELVLERLENELNNNNAFVSIAKHANELSSFQKLKQMKKGLLYQCVRNSIGYRSTVEVDGLKYTGGTCDTAVSANNDVSKLVLESLESGLNNKNYEATNASVSIINHANELSSFQKLNQMRKGLMYQCVQDSFGYYSSTVEVDGIKYTGDTCDTALLANDNVAELVLINLEEIAFDEITNAFARMTI